MLFVPLLLTALPFLLFHKSDPTMPSKQRWFPLESNPELINAYIAKLGFDTSLYQFVDVFSTEDWALEMIPQPVAAVVMLYPLSEKQEAHKDEIADSSNVWYIKQRIGNACGTIGLLHSLMNAPEGLQASYAPDSWLSNFAASCPSAMDPIQKAEHLEADNTIANLHDEATSSSINSTDRGELDDDINTHFVALVHSNGVLYELDGRKGGPVAHGPTSATSLLSDACQVVKKFMDRDPGEMRFTIMALAPKQD